MCFDASHHLTCATERMNGEDYSQPNKMLFEIEPYVVRHVLNFLAEVHVMRTRRSFVNLLLVIAVAGATGAFFFRREVAAGATLVWYEVLAFSHQVFAFLSALLKTIIFF